MKNFYLILLLTFKRLTRHTLSTSALFLILSFPSISFAATQETVNTIPKIANQHILVDVGDGRLIAPDIARIVKRGELIVSMVNADNPPFYFDDNGNTKGIDADLAREIAKELGVKVRFERSAKSFNQVVDMVATRQADIGISKLSKTLQRAQRVHFSTPYLTLNHALILNRLGFAKLSSKQPLSDVIRNFNSSIGVIEKSSYADFAYQNFPNAHIQPYPTWSATIDAVLKGEVMGAYRDEFETKKLLKLNPVYSLSLRTVTLSDKHDSICAAISIQDPTLLNFVNHLIENRSAKLDINSILKEVKSPNRQ